MVNKQKEVEGINYVVCQICGKHLKSINGSHLKLHNITVSEYKLLYPKLPTLCAITHKNYVDGNTGINNPFYGKIHTKERNKYVSNLLMGHSNTPSGENNPFYGRKHTDETLQLISHNRKGKAMGNTNAGDVSGDKNPNWKGGISSQHNLFKSSERYKQWRISIFERDDYTCQECNTRGGDLNVHHILPYRDYPDPQFSLNPKNGITLCVKCHRETFGKEYEYFNKYFDKANGIRQTDE